MFLTPKQTGGPLVFALRQHNHYLAIQVLYGFGIGQTRSTTTDNAVYARLETREFYIGQLAEALSQNAGDTRQEHASLILLACCDGKLFEWLNSGDE